MTGGRRVAAGAAWTTAAVAALCASAAAGHHSTVEFDCEKNPREDNFSGMVFESEYLRPVCIQYQGEGDRLSYVRCDYR